MRAAPVAVATAVAVVAAVGVGVAVASSGDDARTVDAVGVGAVTVDDGSTDDASSSPTGSPSATPTSSATPQQVDGLEQLQGVLVRDSDDDGSDDDGLDDDGSDDDGSDDSSDDRADFEVAGVDLDLGPDGWLVSGGAVADYDGDGTVRPVVEELEALLGQEVTVAGRYATGSDDGDDGRSDDSGRDGRDDDLDVYEIQGLAFRDTTGGPAPWATAGATSTSGATGTATATATTDDDDARDDSDDDGAALPAGSPQRAELERIATDAVGADSRVTSFDREDDGGAAWEVEVLDAQGVEQRVLLDAAGTVLDIRPED